MKWSPSQRMLLVDIVSLVNQSDGTQKQARKTILNTILSYYVDWSEVVPVVSSKYNGNRGMFLFLLLLFSVLFFLTQDNNYWYSAYCIIFQELFNTYNFSLLLEIQIPEFVSCTVNPKMCCVILIRLYQYFSSQVKVYIMLAFQKLYF